LSLVTTIWLSAVQRVEGVEELFLRLLAPREELDVVDKSRSQDPVARAELVHLRVVLDELVMKSFGEPLRGDVDDPRRRPLVRSTRLRDRVDEVGLAEPRCRRTAA
jgi:hypothetical protein